MDKFQPFPEEINRVLASRVADWHFAPTMAGENLLKEGVDPKRVIVTGNTVIDALHIAVKKVKEKPPTIDGLPANLVGDIVLITGHRRENFGDGFEAICQAIAELAERFAAAFCLPGSPEPQRPRTGLPHSQGQAQRAPDRTAELPAVRRGCYGASKLILTDSGGVQEEAPSLGKPVLVMRDTTERPEAVEAGTVKLVGGSKANRRWCGHTPQRPGRIPDHVTGHQPVRRRQGMRADH